MVINIDQFAAFFLVTRKHPLQKIFRLCGQFNGCLVEIEPSRENVGLQGIEFIILRAEGETTTENKIETDAKAEYIGLRKVVILLMEDLFRGIQGAAPIVTTEMISHKEGGDIEEEGDE